MKKVAVIGSGRIVPFHLDALRSTDINISSIAGSKDSINAKKLSETYNIDKYFSHPEELIEDRSWDGLVIACKAEFLAYYLRKALEFDKPILVEKPVGLSSREINEIGLEHSKVLVGYNRRFYPEIQNLHKKLNNLKPVFAVVEIPEKIDFATDLNSANPLLLNSVHMFDLASFLFGELEIVSISHQKNIATVITARSKSHNLIQVLLNYNASSNFSITIDSSPERYILRPLELLTEISGMSIEEPTPSVPVRTYRPNVIREISTDLSGHKFKPGFLGQAKAFSRMLDGEKIQLGASLYDAYNAVKFAEDVTKSLLSGDFH